MTRGPNENTRSIWKPSCGISIQAKVFWHALKLRFIFESQNLKILLLKLTHISHHTMTDILGLFLEQLDQIRLESVFQILHEMDKDSASNEFQKLNLESLLDIPCLFHRRNFGHCNDWNSTIPDSEKSYQWGDGRFLGTVLCQTGLLKKLILYNITIIVLPVKVPCKLLDWFLQYNKKHNCNRSNDIFPWYCVRLEFEPVLISLGLSPNNRSSDFWSIQSLNIPSLHH